MKAERKPRRTRPDTQSLDGLTFHHGPASQTPNGWVVWATKAALEALREAYEASPDCTNEEARVAAGVAYMANMPLLSSHHNACCYIACIAAGLPLQLYGAQDAAKLMYIAQTALSAYRKAV